jgi:hypothetical protein
MPRNMSFQLTTAQIVAGTKTVTRRNGWWFLKPGEVLNAVDRCMGFKKGEHPTKLATIRVVSLRVEPLKLIGQVDCVKEGFPDMEPREFVEMYTKHNKCKPDDLINRIEFEYL